MEERGHFGVGQYVTTENGTGQNYNLQLSYVVQLFLSRIPGEDVSHLPLLLAVSYVKLEAERPGKWYKMGLLYIQIFLARLILSFASPLFSTVPKAKEGLALLS
jgi:hypothetical protein